jgi:hypothetical protein
MSAEPRGRFGLDANARLLVIKIQSEIGHLTVETLKQRMILKVQKEWKLLKENKLCLLCCQRMLWSFVRTVYSELVFHMILLSLRCIKGVYPCWETLGVKNPLIW